MQLITRIVEVYSQIDQQVTTFQLRTGLRCPAGCGRCCPEAEVYTSPMEMLPAAHELLLRGDSQSWLERVRKIKDGLCVFYQRHPIDQDGHCGLYALRPSVCRLFGFASVRNRLGQRVLSTCKLLKKNHPSDVAKAIEHQQEAPCFSQFTAQLIGIDPSASRLEPINIALREAIQTLGLQMQLAHGEKLGSNSAA
ncbi:MAG: YkgJ family cysteine cluster protein [Desulfobacteraceae bacterium]|nr:YkgJ family cysteine cluster protein [Desulfobacteraceae bacterium]